VVAADAGVGYDWQGAGLGYGRPPNLAQDRVELVTAVAVQVQGQVKRPDQLVFKLPRLAADRPARERVFRHPRGQDLLAVDEGLAVSRTDPA
jgi:hypothetical protein